MLTAKTKINVTGSSYRLEEMLQKNSAFKEKSKGLAKELALAVNVSYTTARKWLFEDALPRTAEERIRITEILNIDLLYWEYGFDNNKNSERTYIDNNLLHVVFANKVMEIIHEKQLKIAPEKIIEIELLAINIANKTHSSEPDITLLESLIKLATHQG